MRQEVETIRDQALGGQVYELKKELVKTSSENRRLLAEVEMLRKYTGDDAKPDQQVDVLNLKEQLMRKENDLQQVLARGKQIHAQNNQLKQERDRLVEVSNDLRVKLVKMERGKESLQIGENDESREIKELEEEVKALRDTAVRIRHFDENYSQNVAIFDQPNQSFD